jgi:hypothetical protein
MRGNVKQHTHTLTLTHTFLINLVSRFLFNCSTGVYVADNSKQSRNMLLYNLRPLLLLLSHSLTLNLPHTHTLFLHLFLNDSLTFSHIHHTHYYKLIHAYTHIGLFLSLFVTHILHLSISLSLSLKTLSHICECTQSYSSFFIFSLLLSLTFSKLSSLTPLSFTLSSPPLFLHFFLRGI